MWPALGEAGFLVVAGVLAGICSSSGAIGSLVSYPALLAVGLPPVAANITNAVSVTGVGVGASLRSRTELRGTRERMPRWAAIAGVGAATGATLLLSTPGGVFAWVVPFLILAAAALMLLQPRIDAARGTDAVSTRAFGYGLFAVSVYEGYFGAGAGVMTLALVLLTVERSLPRANAVKNVLLGVADVVAAILFILLGPVHWEAAVPLGLGFFAGGSVGPAVVRRVPPAVLRGVIALAAVGLACRLLVQAFGGGPA